MYHYEGTMQSQTLSDLGDKIAKDFWNIVEHPDFPFSSLASNVNNGRNFPPYNIVEESSGVVRLEMAVAGYSRDRLTVHLDGNALVIKGLPSDPKYKPGIPADTFRHKGISNTAFTRSFEMNRNAVVDSVTYLHGIITVIVKLKAPETAKPIAFEIK